jgi:lysozyme
MINAVADVSHYQDDIDFNKVAADGILGLIHKATQGTSYTDSRYLSRRPLALGAGLMWGAYHFGIGGDGAAQARYFLDVVKPAPTDLLVLDFEPNTSSGGNMTTAQAEAFVQYVQQHTGRYPGLYATSDYLTQNKADQSKILTQCWLWVARYSASLTTPPHPAAWRTWTMWQYTDGTNGATPHAVQGIGNCDRDKFNGSEAGLRALWNCPAPVANV